MTKQWKKSLEQNDILADGQPFEGANIDQPLSAVEAGFDPRNFSGQVLSVFNETKSVSGSGYLVSIIPGGSNENVDIEIDGELLANPDNEEWFSNLPVLARFNSELKLSAKRFEGAYVAYLLE